MARVQEEVSTSVQGTITGLRLGNGCSPVRNSQGRVCGYFPGTEADFANASRRSAWRELREMGFGDVLVRNDNRDELHRNAEPLDAATVGDVSLTDVARNQRILDSYFASGDIPTTFTGFNVTWSSKPQPFFLFKDFYL